MAFQENSKMLVRVKKARWLFPILERQANGPFIFLIETVGQSPKVLIAPVKINSLGYSAVFVA